MEPGLDRREHQSAALRRDCELWRLSRVQSIFGGTTEIQKEIIGRSLGRSGATGEAGGPALSPGLAGPREPPYVRLSQSVPGVQAPGASPGTGGLRLDELPGHSVPA